MLCSAMPFGLIKGLQYFLVEYMKTVQLRPQLNSFYMFLTMLLKDNMNRFPCELKHNFKSRKLIWQLKFGLLSASV